MTHGMRALVVALWLLAVPVVGRAQHSDVPYLPDGLDSSPVPGTLAPLPGPSLEGPAWDGQGWSAPPLNDPAAPFLRQNQPQVLEDLYGRVLDLEPNPDNRRAIERIRTAVQETEIGVDVSAEEWIETNGIQLEWGGRIHTDWVAWANDSQFGPNGQPNYFEFRRLRLAAAGTGYGVYFYQLELEFFPDFAVDELAGDVGRGAGVELKDAFVGITDIPWIGRFRAGHMFAPIGLERLTSSNDITFLERSLQSRFLPAREVGVVANNWLPSENATWAYGAFLDDVNESTKASVDDNQGVRVVGRVTALPFYDELAEGRYLVHLGAGYAYTRPRKRDNLLMPGIEYRPVAFTIRPEIHQGDPLIASGLINTEQYQIANAELAWVHGPFSVQSEFTWTGIDQPGGAAMSFYGTYAYASYFFTGEHRVYDRRNGTFEQITPYENFWVVPTPHGACAGWGAWEAAVRWSYVDMSDVMGQQLNDLTVGLNWYWNPHTRFMLNWIHPMAHNSPVGTEPNSSGDIVGMRLQVDF